jgi:hypothetical protein
MRIPVGDASSGSWLAYFTILTGRGAGTSDGMLRRPIALI